MIVVATVCVIVSSFPNFAGSRASVLVLQRDVLVNLLGILDQRLIIELVILRDRRPLVVVAGPAILLVGLDETHLHDIRLRVLLMVLLVWVRQASWTVARLALDALHVLRARGLLLRPGLAFDELGIAACLSVTCRMAGQALRI